MIIAIIAICTQSLSVLVYQIDHLDYHRAESPCKITYSAKVSARLDIILRNGRRKIERGVGHRRFIDQFRHFDDLLGMIQRIESNEVWEGRVLFSLLISVDETLLHLGVCCLEAIKDRNLASSGTPISTYLESQASASNMTMNCISEMDRACKTLQKSPH